MAPCLAKMYHIHSPGLRDSIGQSSETPARLSPTPPRSMAHSSAGFVLHKAGKWGRGQCVSLSPRSPSPRGCTPKGKAFLHLKAPSTCQATSQQGTSAQSGHLFSTSYKSSRGHLQEILMCVDWRILILEISAGEEKL